MTEKTDAPKESTDTKAKTAPAAETEATKKTGNKTNNAVWMGTAVGVGSAALVAALMYAKRRK